MSFLRSGVVLALAGFSLPSVVFAAPAQKGSAASKAPQEAAPVPADNPTSPSSVVTEEMRSANEAASSSAEAAIASLKAARAAIAAEKSREGSGSDAAGVAPGGTPTSPTPPVPAGRKGKVIEKLDPLPSRQEPQAAPSASAPAPAGAAAQPGQPGRPMDLKAAVNDFKTSMDEANTAPLTGTSAGTPVPPAGSPPPVSPAVPQAAVAESPKPSPAVPPTPTPPTTAPAAPVAEAPKPAPQNAPTPESGPPRPSIESAAAAAATAASAAAAEPAPAGESKKKSRFGGDDALGDAAKKKGKGKSKEPVVKLTPEQQKAAEIKAFCDKARDAIKRGEEEVARGLLESLVAVDLPSAEKKIALTEVAAVYEEKGDLTKTIAILEKLTNVLDSDIEVPVWLLKLGQLYREAGAYQMAISRYYGVIQLAMKVGSSDFQRFQAISRQAQREIANTYFIKGDFDQAQKFYNMALRSDLPKEERAVALFRAAHCTFMRGDMNGAINGLERFLKDFSRHASAAEARYMLATAYKTEGRPQDAYDSVIDLLRDAKSKSEEDPKAWAFWQKKAGNEFANDYYQRGEFVNAVTIYQALAAIEESPEWRWPVVYQMGLCFERLRIEPRASECYKYIVDENKRPEFRWRKMPQSVANLVQMASWRVEQLEWDGVANGKLRAVVGMDLSRPVPRGIRP